MPSFHSQGAKRRSWQLADISPDSVRSAKCQKRKSRPASQ
jgi:hypothetical protein